MHDQWRPRPWPDLTRRRLFVRPDAAIARRKPVSLQCSTPLAAVAVMDAMDYDAHVFTDAETGEDAVVYRAGPRGCGWLGSGTYIRRDGLGRRAIRRRRYP